MTSTFPGLFSNPGQPSRHCLRLHYFCVAAFLMARRKPLLSFCMLFFFLNHLVEGTVIPLELIYEHRNYIPSMLFFVPVAYGMVRCLDYFSYRKEFAVFHGRRLRAAPGVPGTHDLRAKRHCPLRCPSLARQRQEGARPQPPPHQPGKALLRGGDVRRGVPRAENRRGIEPGHQSAGRSASHLTTSGSTISTRQRISTGRNSSFIKALERFPGHPSAIVGLANVHLKRAEVERALI